MSNEQWWKAGPFMDSDGQEYWSVRRSPIGLGVAERVYDERMADRIVSLHAEHQEVAEREEGLGVSSGVGSTD